MATRQQQIAFIYDQQRRTALIQDGVPFSKEISNAAWTLLGSAVKVDDATFSLAAVAGSSLVAPLPTDLGLSFGQSRYEVDLRLASMDTGALPFSVRLEYYSNAVLQAFTLLTFTELGGNFSFFRDGVSGANTETFFPEFRIATGDSSKAATLELQNLIIKPLKFAKAPMLGFPKRLHVVADSAPVPISPVVVNDENNDLATVTIQVYKGVLLF